MRAFIFTSLIVLSFIQCGSQNKDTYIDISEISINSITHKTSIEQLKEILPAPVSYKELDDSEGMAGDTPGIYYYFKYDSLNIDYMKYDYMLSSRVINIEFTSNLYKLKIKNKTVTIGDNIATLQKLVPQDYKIFLEKNSEIKQDKIYEIVASIYKDEQITESNIYFRIKNSEIIFISVNFPDY